MTSEAMTIEPCPTCGSAEAGIVEAELHPGTSFVRCAKCGHIGPELMPRQEPDGTYKATAAWAAWNKDSRARRGLV